LLPSKKGFDDFTIEYPFPFWNPADRRFYVYYLGRRERPPKQTGLLVGDGDFGQWTRVCQTPVIAADTDHERYGSSHPSVVVVDDTIHIIYTGESTGLSATQPRRQAILLSSRKDPANPIFKGTGQAWDSCGIREAEIFTGPRYFHVLYGGSDGEVWRVGHVRTNDFRTFEPNPDNPVFTPSPDSSAWDCDGILMPQVIEIDNIYYMVYAGKRGNEWQTGLAKARKELGDDTSTYPNVC
tara:strand:- start:1302 stop:2018 length:717 start_codon:yes stop_codon:yes gene_type:complete